MKVQAWPLVTIVLVGAILFPLYWVAIASFTPERRIFAPPALVPEALVLDHYRALFDGRDFWLMPAEADAKPERLPRGAGPE